MKRTYELRDACERSVCFLCDTRVQADESSLMPADPPPEDLSGARCKHSLTLEQVADLATRLSVRLLRRTKTFYNTTTLTMSSMACLNIEIPKKPANKTPSEHRRATKPIMEKRRRARINHSLNELKSLILDALHKDPTRNSKLEKADILEMTVRHLQNVQRQTMALEIARDPTVLSKYRAGFSECATEVSRYIAKIDGADHQLKQRLTSHLSTCLQSLPSATSGASANTAAASIAFPGMTIFTPPGQSPLQVHIPAGHSIFSSSAGTPVPVNLTTSSSSSSDMNNNRRMESESKLTPPASATSSFSFSFPTSTMSPVTPTTPSTPGSSARLMSPSGYHISDFRFAPYHRSAWPTRREMLRSISPGSSSSMGSLSPAGSDSLDCDSIASCDKNQQKGEDVWRPW